MIRGGGWSTAPRGGGLVVDEFLGWRSSARLPAMYRISSRCGFDVATAAAAEAAAVGLSCKWKQSVSILGLMFLFSESNDDDDVNDSTTTTTSNDAMMTMATGSSRLRKLRNFIIWMGIGSKRRLHSMHKAHTQQTQPPFPAGPRFFVF